MRTLFLDTNIFMHCKPLDEIDWCALLEVEKVEIIVPSIVFRELDEHKDNHPKGHLRKRARARLNQLDAWLDGDQVVRQNVRVSDYGYPSPSIFEANGLASDRNDDVLIASMLECKFGHPEANLVLVAHDSGPRRTAKRFDLEAIDLPGKYRLPPKPDPLEAENQELKRELQRLKHAVPKLSLAFATESEPTNRTEVSVQRIAPLTERSLKKRLDELRKKHPPLEIPKQKQGSAKVNNSSMSPKDVQGLLRQGLWERLQPLQTGLGTMNNIAEEDIEKYNRELQIFYRGYEDYYRNSDAQRVAEGLTGILNLVMINEGAKPGEDIDIYMHFPDGFSLYREHDLPEFPKPPTAPDRPKTKLEKSMALSVPYSPTFAVPEIPSFNFSPSNVSGFDIKKTHSYDVQVHVERIKHGVPEKLDSLYLIFNDFDSASSFQIDYELKAANLPDPVSGKLNVKVNKMTNTNKR